MNPSRNDIPIGRRNAISRAQLTKLWGCSDRTARQYIAEFRAEVTGEQYAILSSSRGDGYWMSNDPKEIQAFIDEMQAHAVKTFVAQRAAKHVLKNIDQVAMNL
jgi:hypothetical protein